MSNSTSEHPSSQGRSRSYHSSLRKKQAEATRQLILETLAEQIVADGLQNFSIADAAQRAGVSPRTIYRHFPNREALLDALGEWVDQQLGEIPFPATPDEVAEVAEIVFPRFEEKATLVQALLISELGKNVRSRRLTMRRQAVTQSLQPVLRHLDPDEAKGICALIQQLGSAAMWQALREEDQLSGEASGKAVAWAIRTLVTELQHQNGLEGALE